MAIPVANTESCDTQKTSRCRALPTLSENGGRDKAPEVQGKIPHELKGSLYRNGSGLFERQIERRVRRRQH
jgi:carotenoid cleavage dioxygenase-like enzyme